MALTSGEFQPGAATAKAFTLNAEKWVAPAQASREVNGGGSCGTGIEAQPPGQFPRYFAVTAPGSTE